MRRAKVFSKIDLGSGYQQVRIKDEYVHKTSFRARYGSYEFVVVPFGFTNAPAMFMCFKNNVFSSYFDKCVLVFLDDTLTYSRDEEKLVEQLRLILKLFKKHTLYAKLSRCDLYEHRIHYLGHIILDKGIYVDPERIVAIMRTPAPRKMTFVRSFLGFVVYCRKLFEGYSTGKVEPMYRLMSPTCVLVVT